MSATPIPTPCAVCGKAEPHRGPEGCDRVLSEPVCDFCGDTGREPTWRMTRDGLEEAERKCKHCSAGDLD